MNEERKYTEVWGDTVVIRELFIAILIGIILTMGFFLLGTAFFTNNPNIEPSLAKGYSLLVGITGCVLSGGISSKLFKPKRNLEERMENVDVEDILRMANISVEDESEALGKASPEIIAEMEEMELWGFLALIPEDSPNYKKEYKERIRGDLA